jgi:hypothetical protein
MRWSPGTQVGFVASIGCGDVQAVTAAAAHAVAAAQVSERVHMAAAQCSVRTGECDAEFRALGPAGVKSSPAPCQRRRAVARAADQGKITRWFRRTQPRSIEPIARASAPCPTRGSTESC